MNIHQTDWDYAYGHDIDRIVAASKDNAHDSFETYCAKMRPRERAMHAHQERPWPAIDVAELRFGIAFVRRASETRPTQLGWLRAAIREGMQMHTIVTPDYR